MTEAVQPSAASEVSLLRSTNCAECGGGYMMYWRDRLACFGCALARHLHEPSHDQPQEVEERVLVALRGKLMGRDLFEGFCRAYVAS